MDFINETKLPASWTMGFERDGRELVVAVIKGTFDLLSGPTPKLAGEQVPLTQADEFTGEPGISAPLHETDYAHRKPACDVLLNGSAYAPNRMDTTVGVGLRVGTMVKTFTVVGNRVWRKGVLGIRVTVPEPFSVMPISYDNAFGGVDDTQSDAGDVKTYVENPAGRGYFHFKDRIDGRPLPNTEETYRPVADPSGKYTPMAFGVIGRNWQPRNGFAGTYDKAWMAERAPFWPDDFDYRYFQAAPADQWIPYPSGGEEVVLKNLTPDGLVRFALPTLPMPVLFIPHRGRDQEVRAVIDTILIEPDARRYLLTWRASLPMLRSCFDVKEIVAGEMPRGRHLARRAADKPYYRSLGELARARLEAS